MNQSNKGVQKEKKREYTNPKEPWAGKIKEGKVTQTAL
jgi:hypothetical protein